MKEEIKIGLQLYYGSLLYELEQCKGDIFAKRKIEGKLSAICVLLEIPNLITKSQYL